MSSTLTTERNPHVIGYWKLDENAANTTVVDASGIQSAATASQNTSIMHAAAGGFTFNGTTDYVDIPHIASQLNITDGFSLSALIKPTTIGETAGRIFDKTTSSNTAGGFSLQMGSNRVMFNVNNGGPVNSANSSVPFGSTSHVIVTVTSAGLVTFYVNGVASGTPASTGALTGITTTNNIRIGNRSTATDRTFDGVISQVGFYDKVLTAAEALTIYASGSPSAPSFDPFILMAETVAGIESASSLNDLSVVTISKETFDTNPVDRGWSVGSTWVYDSVNKRMKIA